jgi:hypothetical protein
MLEQQTWFQILRKIHVCKQTVQMLHTQLFRRNFALPKLGRLDTSATRRWCPTTLVGWPML